jgi:hypothetical protein
LETSELHDSKRKRKHKWNQKEVVNLFVRLVADAFIEAVIDLLNVSWVILSICEAALVALTNVVNNFYLNIISLTTDGFG